MTALTPTRASRPQLPALTGVRFLAALLVVLLHAHSALRLDVPPLLRPVVESGQLSVTLFFILSGFILVYTYARTDRLDTMTVSGPTFWQARFARIYPVYALGLLLDAPFFLGAWLGGGLHLSGPVTLALAPTLLQAWVPPSACVWNCPGWSISAEAFFYLLFPALLPLALAVARRGVWAGFAPVWLLSLLPVVAVLVLTPELPREVTALDVLYYAPLFRVPEFLLGMALAQRFLNAPPGPRQAQVARWFGLVVIAVLVVAGPSVLNNNLRNLLAIPAFGALVWGLAPGHGRLAAALGRPLPVYLGEISYGIYILHAPLLNLLVERGARTWTQGHPALLILAGVLGALIVIAGVTYRFLERPAQAALRRRTRRPVPAT
ncbi:peptidoglycan/LPS O-acetylase OafA/YrhL [Deinococcus metalli]|uniref:Acyltransferase n=1 Tax=Deinococcus metalli TaxID=1141878 RepID=A0A7W8KDW6_9DEIO|nr:acyltransferase [Deinococcus metalli]MBB5375943.1 peptidoglycan/LPS O-acetylase OafA/YrhL [Deinococcus metalli]GHF35929.1 acyltransferase [Deinococcus metalli]